MKTKIITLSLIGIFVLSIATAIIIENKDIAINPDLYDFVSGVNRGGEGSNIKFTYTEEVYDNGKTRVCVIANNIILFFM